MTTDKVFILLLVIMLPLTGCLDVTDTAEAEDSDEETTIVNNYYNNTTTTSMPMVHSLHLEQGENATLEFDGTKTMKVETLWSGINQIDDNMRANTHSLYPMQMTCDNDVTVTGSLTAGIHLPVLGGQNCSVLITANDYPVILVFSEASLSDL